MSPRTPLPLLQNLSHRIAAEFTAATLDEATKSIWSGNARSLYVEVVRVDEMLMRGDVNHARPRLQQAASRYEQVRSELHALGESGSKLEAELTTVFSICKAWLSARIPDLPAVPSPSRVERISHQEYVLPCSICGQRAVAIHPAGAEEKILKGTICAGITRAVGLRTENAPRIFAWLEKGDLPALHRYMEIEADIDGGLDAYCPQCDLIYCRTHYQVEEKWDDGFYDCAIGTCPRGHSREIDD